MISPLLMASKQLSKFEKDQIVENQGKENSKRNFRFFDISENVSLENYEFSLQIREL